MTDHPQCSGVRCGGPDHDWRDVPCPEPATTTFDGEPCCEDHRARFEANAHERFAAEGFFAGVALERLRQIQAAGGLAKLLEAFDASAIALEAAQHALKHGATSLRACGFNECNAMAFGDDDTDECGISAAEYRVTGHRLETVCGEARNAAQEALDAAKPYRPKED